MLDQRIHPVRSALFNGLFYSTLILFVVGGSFFFITPRRWSMWALKQWAKTSLWLLKGICGIDMEVRGREHIPEGPCVLIGKHQSFWDIFALLPLLSDPALVLKRELGWIPFFGWFAVKFQMIFVNRKAGTKALRHLKTQADRALKQGRQVLIFPEGTRRPIGAPPAYKPGVSALYAQSEVPFVPFALNSGVFWPRRRPLVCRGTIVVAFLPALPPHLPRKVFEDHMIASIETSVAALISEEEKNHPDARELLRTASQSAKSLDD